VTELIEANENVVNTYRYTPFGDALVRDETVYNPHQFTGRQYDAESGLYHYRARAYSPDIGRFMQQDPAGMADGANMYAYVGNNPVNFVDSKGTTCYNPFTSSKPAPTDSWSIVTTYYKPRIWGCYQKYISTGLFIYQIYYQNWFSTCLYICWAWLYFRCLSPAPWQAMYCQYQNYLCAMQCLAGLGTSSYPYGII
jgi:RHS repeat-associated protein